MTHITTAQGLSSNSNYVVYADPYAPVIWTGTIGAGHHRIAYHAAGYAMVIVVAGMVLFNYFRTKHRLKNELFKEKLEK